LIATSLFGMHKTWLRILCHCMVTSPTRSYGSNWGSTKTGSQNLHETMDY